MAFDSPQADLPKFNTQGCYMTDLLSYQSQFNAVQDQIAALNKEISGITSAAIYNSTGSPEGVITAAIGSLYIDKTSDSIWYKKTGTGNAGWIQLIA